MITTLLIIKLLAISFGVAILFIQEPYWMLIEKWKIDKKPINCALCLTFWISFIFIVINGLNIPISLSLAIINAVIGELIYRKLNFMQ